MNTKNDVVYPYTPEEHVVQLVPLDNPFLQEAKRVACSESTDLKQPTGAVLVQNGNIVAHASNQSALTEPTLLRWHRKFLCIRKLLKIPTGTGYWMCPGCAGSSYHAEARLMRKAKKQNIRTEGGDIYLWGHWWCCEPCWNAMLEGGISNVYVADTSAEIFNSSDTKNILGKQCDLHD